MLSRLTAVLGRTQPNIGALQEELNAILEIVVERNLRNGGIDRNLQRRPIDLLQRALDDAVAFLVGVDQQVIVDDIRGDSHIGKNWRRRARRRVRPMTGDRSPRWRGRQPAGRQSAHQSWTVATSDVCCDPPAAGVCAGRGGLLRCRWLDRALLEATMPLPGAQLVVWRIQSTAAAADEHVVEERRDLARIAVAHAVYLDVGARTARFVQSRDPGCHPFE